MTIASSPNPGDQFSGRGGPAPHMAGGACWDMGPREQGFQVMISGRGGAEAVELSKTVPSDGRCRSTCS